jgi:DNA-binding transcriptional LysR family regulator
MEFRQMRYFLLVAEEMHFHRAAEGLHVSQPSLSQQIRHLQEELGISLFERTYRNVCLTSVGERFLKKTRQVLRCVEAAI